MASNQKTSGSTQPNDAVGDQQSFAITSPSISLPKGGGAIRGMGEKFAANPVTGTGSMSIPIAVSPGRSGFNPQLSLSYDSGSGNGSFGLGWSLSIPSITRKTDKGLPQYRDACESDVFILSGAEDLVPVSQDENNVAGYSIRRYRPRLEGLFAHIERWTRLIDGDVHWRSISKDNILALYGKDAASRIVDPNDRSRIFSWLICETRDDKGNAILYDYKAEDSAGVNLALAHERNRGSNNDPRRSANRYLKRIRYGNRKPLLDASGDRPYFLQQDEIDRSGWMFEAVFDYGEHDLHIPLPADGNDWACRHDSFSSYRSGFEVRTYRLCQRVLMFHHFPDEPGVGNDCLVCSTDFSYREIRDNPEDIRRGQQTASFIAAVTHSGYASLDTGGYTKQSMPPVEFEYSQAVIDETIRELDSETLQNLPIGLDGARYQWVDLNGEGISGILTEQADAWYYKSNLGEGRLGNIQVVARTPSTANLSGHSQQLLDLTGNGQIDLVEFGGNTPGFFERTGGEDWASFKPFRSLPNIRWDDPNLRFVDLDGDGHADVLITEQDAFTWYPSLAEEGFDQAQRVVQAREEESGPRLIFADGAQSIYLADMSGDGLTDLVRIRNGEVCYWPNLGYGRFGPKITMDNSPWFDHPDQFNQQRIRLADIDGSGCTDIIYLGRAAVHLYFNQSGNFWSEERHLNRFPLVDNFASVMTADLLGNGTACLVWSTSLPNATGWQMSYIDLMGGQKPNLLLKTVNNLGAETRVHYVSSTKFYLADKAAGKPWITRLPFPVHVVERVETFDHISRNRFVTRNAYHHGYYDGVEREFRGFGLVETWNTEMFSALSQSTAFPTASNQDAASHVPPVYTKTWFHTGIYLGREHVSDFFAGMLDERPGEYYREPGLSNEQAKQLLLKDTELPDGLSSDEEREACRALKGSMLRQEVYALDGTEKEAHPYRVSEQNFTIKQLQAKGENRHGVFFAHPRESISYHYERNPVDPRITHNLTIEVDEFGNVLKQIAVAYGRCQADTALPHQNDQGKQTQTLVTYNENRITNPLVVVPGIYRAPLPCETRIFELTGYLPSGLAGRFQFSDFVLADDNASNRFIHVFDNEISYETQPGQGRQRRLIEHVRTLYRKDDLTALLGLGVLESRALPGESYRLAFTPGLLSGVYDGRVTEEMLAAECRYVHSEGDASWWIPSGRMFYSPGSSDIPAQELAYARRHFFLPQRYRDPFHSGSVSTESSVTYDAYDLLMLETRDALGNRTTVGERKETVELDLSKPGNDYRVLQPWRVMDANRNRTQLAFDALGMVVGTAVMGKPEETLGDSLDEFDPDLTEEVIQAYLGNPLADPLSILKGATTRLVYDLGAYQRTKNNTNPQSAVVYTMVRETHHADSGGTQTKVQHSFSYSDGFGREIQKKIQAEPGKVPRRDANGDIIVADDGYPAMSIHDASPRWVGSGWTIFNNKGKPVRQYEPFFTDTHRFEFGVQIGISPILFYDPVDHVVATLHPNHTYEKVVFDPWRQTTYDVNDTVLDDPRIDDDIKGYVAEYFKAQSATWSTWYDQRQSGAMGTQEQVAANKAAAHADTPTTAYFDTLGRPFLTLSRNRVACPNHSLDGEEKIFATRIELDIEGNQREVRDAIEQAGDKLGRIVMCYSYDMLGSRIHQHSMEAGARWMLNDVAGKPVRAWDSRGHHYFTTYDALRRPIGQYVRGTTNDSDPRTRQADSLLIDKIEYGESHPNAEALNLRTRAFRHFDSAGIICNVALNPNTNQNEAYDFKGNQLRSTRQLVSDYKSIPNWLFDPKLDDETFTSSTRYDALNRPVQSVAPHSSVARAKCNVIQAVFNEANLFEKVDVWLDRSAEPDAVLNPVIEVPSAIGISNINYDAKGQRQSIEYKNGASTLYDYDPLTFRLVHLLTKRNATAFPDDCKQPPPADWPGCAVQNLRYTYDPVGNITHIQDDAQQTIYFKNQRVEPSNDYAYDALYRLIEATGREHLGQGGTPIPHSYNDAGRAGLLSADAANRFSANDGNAMGSYIERYVYDAVGNFMEMQHRGSNPAHGWTRGYTYDETSLIEDGLNGGFNKTSNRLSKTTINPNSNNPVVEPYRHDAHGNILAMPHLQLMQWDYKDQLRTSQRQKINDEDAEGIQHHGDRTYYVYDAGGQRIRKVTELAGGNLIEERIYLGGFETFRRHKPDGSGIIDESTVKLERETLHIMDDKQRIALVETRTFDKDDSDLAPQQLIRYQFGNHLGSASLELDHQAQIISYEEYTPYGSSSYQAVRSQTETAKRYRYTGKERDEETGFTYHGARYYAAWLGRWESCDPRLFVDGLNLYRYVKSNPMILVDATGGECGACIAIERDNRAVLEGKMSHEQYMERAKARAGGAAIGVALVAAFWAAPEAAALALARTEKVITFALANPGKVIAATSFGIGVLDPHPPGTSPLDIPGPLDDLGRASKAVSSEAFEMGAKELKKTVLPAAEVKIASDVEKKIVVELEKVVAKNGGDVAAPTIGSTEKFLTNPALREGQLHESEQLAKLEIPKNTSIFRPTEEEVGTATFKAIVGDSKYTKGGQLKATIFDGIEGGYWEIKGGTSELASSYQLRLQTYKSVVDRVPYTIQTTRPVNQSFQAYLDFWGVNVVKPTK